MGTDIKMNIDINFGITEIQVLNIDINFGITAEPGERPPPPDTNCFKAERLISTEFYSV